MGAVRLFWGGIFVFWATAVSPVFAHDCSGALGENGDPARVLHQRYSAALDAGDDYSARYNLLRLIQLHSAQLGFTHSDKYGLSLIENAQHATYSKDKYLNLPTNAETSTEGGLGRLAALVNLDPLLHKTTPDGEARAFSARMGDVGKKWVRDFAWAGFGPLIYRPIIHMWQLLQSKRAYMRLNRLIYQERTKLARVVGMEADENFDRIAEQLVEERERRRTEIRFLDRMPGSLLRPAVIAGALIWNGVHPYQFAREALTPDEYPMTTMAKQMDQQVGIQWEGKKVRMISDRSFYRRMGIPDHWLGVKEDPSRPLVDLDPWREKAQSFVGKAAADFQEFRRELDAASDADILILMAHGTPGDFAVGDQKLSDHLETLRGVKLKKDVVVVFLSCSFGDKEHRRQEETEEPWVRLSKQLLANSENGRSVAAIVPIMVWLKNRDAIPRAEEEKMDPEAAKMLENIIRTVATMFSVASQSMGATQAEIVLKAWDAKDRAFFGQVGLRVYDHRTGTITLHPFQE